MFYRLLVDLTVCLHFAFVLFAIFGGLLLFWSKRLIWLHLPALLWGIFIEFSGGICPLTPLENFFRQEGGMLPYQAGFIAHYLLPILYPAGLTHRIQWILGTLLLLFNAAVYCWIFGWKKR
ncbi:MAG: DUF2784 domain-containing protein [bacterium]|nr:DUF2784 domain-containing protein [bacterium]